MKQATMVNANIPSHIKSFTATFLVCFIKKRLEQAKAEIRRAGEFEYLVTNDNVENAARNILAIITAEKLKASKNICTAKELE